MRLKESEAIDRVRVFNIVIRNILELDKTNVP